MYEISLSLSKAQANKLSKGLPVQLTDAQLHSKSTKLIVHPENAKKISKAMKKRKGVRIQMGQDEVAQNIQGGFLPAMALLPFLGPALGQAASSVVGKIFG
jgi:hypothetical protein